MDFLTFLKSRLATVGLLVLLAGVLYVSTKLWVQKYQVDKQIADLQTKTNQLSAKNQKLSDLIKYFQSPQYTEQQAREKLSLKKEGEQVVALPKSTEEQANAETQSNQSNPQKWFEYFFGR